VITLQPGAANKLAFGVQPSTTIAGSAISPAFTVIVQDQYGNTVTGDASTVIIGSGNTSFTSDSTLSVAASSGVATFGNLKPTTVGTAITLTASDGSLAGATSSPFTVKAAGYVASDNFNRTDPTDLGSNWTPLSGTPPSPFLGQLVIVNNQAGVSALGVDCVSYWSANTFNDDQYSQAIIPKIGYYTSVIVRAGGSTPNRFYEAYVTATGYGIAVYWDGSWSAPLVSGSTVAWQAGDTNRLEVTGSASPVTLTMYRNGSPVLTTSTSVYVKTGGSPGIDIGDRDGVGLTFDDWEGGNVLTARLVITGNGTQTAGGSQNLTITALDPYGNRDMTYTGAKSLTFSGASSSVNPVTAPTVTDSSGTAVTFGLPTAITFSSGVATVSGGDNGAMTLYKAETATISVSDGSRSSSGSDRLTVTVSASSVSKFALSLTSPQITGVAFTGVNTLTAQDLYGNTVGFDASTNNVTIAANSPLTGTVSGLSGGSTLTGAGDFSSGVANLMALGLTYTGNANSGTFTATAAAGGYTGSSGSVTISAVGSDFATDTFDRANASDLGGNWTPLLGSGQFGHLVIVNNQAGVSGPNTDCYSYWSHDTFRGNQYSQAVIPTIGNYSAVIVRASGAQDRFYFAFVSGQNTYGIAMRWLGVNVYNYLTLVDQTGIPTPETWGPGDTLKLSVTGDGSVNPIVLTLYRNGNPVLTYTSPSSWQYAIAAGGPGLGGQNLPLDEWEGGNLTVAISGTVAYYPTNYPSSGLSGKRVGNVTMTVTGGANLSVVTLADGSYGPTNVPIGGTYCVTPSKTDDSPTANGVDSSDQVVIQRHILGRALLDSPYKLLAADVDGNRSIDSSDQIAIQRLILGRTSQLPAGLWRFVPADYVFPDSVTDPQTPWDAPTNRWYTNLVADVPNGDFVAIKLGDVDNSWTAPVGGSLVLNGSKVGAALAVAVPEVLFAVSQQSAQPGQTVAARVTVSGFSQVTSAQFSLAWDPAVLRYMGTGSYGLRGMGAGCFGTSLSESGTLGFAWFDPEADGVTLPDGAVLFTVSFEVIGKAGSVSAVALAGAPVVQEVSVDVTPVGFGAQDGGVAVVGSGVVVSKAGYANGVFRLSVPTEQGRSYSLEFTDTLAPTKWTALPAVAGDGTAAVLVDPGATNQQRFYRIHVQ
jgi:hypothetical protein